MAVGHVYTVHKTLSASQNSQTMLFASTYDRIGMFLMVELRLNGAHAYNIRTIVSSTMHCILATVIVCVRVCVYVSV